MTVVPNFILKRLYAAGSLRRLPEGIAFDIVNNLGPGTISKLGYIRIGNHEFTPNQITLRVDGKVLHGDTISDENPAHFFLHETITCIVQDQAIPAGSYQIGLELISKEAGKVNLTVQDDLT